MKRIISLILALSMLFACLFIAGCSGKSYQPLITYGTKSISVNMFTYLLSQAKTMALYTLMGQTTDAPEAWDTDTGKLLADYIKEDAVSTAMSVVYYAQMAEENGISLTEEDKKQIQDNLDTLVESHGSKNALNTAMASYGVNYDIIKEYFTLQLLAQKGMSFVLGENGTHPITNDDYLEYYNENFATLRHISLNNINKLADTGKTTVLTDDEKAAVEKKADDIMLSVASGDDLSVFAADSNDALMEAYPDGLTIPLLPDMLYQLAYTAEQEGTFNVFGLYYYLLTNVEGFNDTAKTLSQGEVKRMDTQKGIYILQKMPLNMEMFELYKEIMIANATLEPIKTKQLIKSLESEFVVDQATLDTFTVKGATTMPL